jgi:Flp pilus assembly protein TadG
MCWRLFRPRRMGLRSERGSGLVEAAFVAPVFFALLLGGIEGGVVFYERLTVNNMSMAGVRSASGQGNDVLADYQVLRSIQTAEGGMAGGQINMIVVYRATSSSDRVPVGCKTASVATTCNRYVSADLAKDVSQFGCTGPPGPSTKIDNAWCPTGRKTALSGAGGPPDYIGVYVEAQHRELTGVFGDNVVLRSDSVFRMEPRTLT